ncbi:MAG: LiaF domain-containing protein [Kofleriaceae bacterium]
MPDSLVALRDRRAQVIAQITECYAIDVLDVDELDRRLDLAHSARTIAELEELIADLGPSRAPSTALVPAGPTAIDDPERAASTKLRVLFGSVQRRGRWSVAKRLKVSVTFGDSQLDFREASLGPGVTTIDVGVTFGNLEVLVPPWLAVDVDVSSMFGNVEERHRVPPETEPSQPVLRLVGAVRFGNLEISTRLPGESAKDARKRERKELKHERKRLERERKALPPGKAM